MWTLEVEDKNQMDIVTISCNFILSCSGYYSYEKGYTPDFENINEFNGKIMHPQQWDTSIDYTNKVIVVGSGATAVTLVPEMAKMQNMWLFFKITYLCSLCTSTRR